MYENDCVAYAEIDDFVTNVTPNDLQNKYGEVCGPEGALETPLAL